MCKGCDELLILGFTVRPLKDQGKQNKRGEKHDKMRRWKYKLGRMELFLQVFLVGRKSTEQEMTSRTEGGKTEGRIKLDVLFLELDSTKVIVELQRLEILKNRGGNWRQHMENIQRCGLLGSVFLVEENDDIKCLKPVKKSIWGSVKTLMAKHSFELGRVWEPGIVAGRQVCRDTEKKHHKSSVSAVDNGENNFSKYCITYFEEWKKKLEAVYGISCSHPCEYLLRSDEEAPKLFVELRRWQQHLHKHGWVYILKGDNLVGRHLVTLKSEHFVHVLLQLTYEVFHSARPPEVLGISDHVFKSETFGSSVDWEDYQSGNKSPSPQQFSKFFTISAKITKVAERYQTLSKKRLQRRDLTKIICLQDYVLWWGKKDKHEEPSVLKEQKGASTRQLPCLNLEDKVDFKGGSNVMCASILDQTMGMSRFGPSVNQACSTEYEILEGN